MENSKKIVHFGSPEYTNKGIWNAQFVTQINIQKKKMPLKVHDRTLKLTFHWN